MQPAGGRNSRSVSYTHLADFYHERQACLAIEEQATLVVNPAMEAAQPPDGSELARQARSLELLFCDYAARMITALSLIHI